MAKETSNQKSQSYNPAKIEKKWQEYWAKNKLYKAEDFSKNPKFYCLDMFPYPSGEGLHVGHWRGYVLSDVISRYQMLCGKNVLHPMGWDAFGLPAENAAIQNRSHPKIFTKQAIETFRRQLEQIGACFDWSREINTSDPNYYKWTQWLFLKLYENGLAFRQKAPVNWCPGCQTVLANEQVIAGECERCGSKVTKKDLTQWFLKITDFAEELLNDLDDLDWPERTKTLQRNWIGRSEGTNIKFKIKDSDREIQVFTTRADTLFGCTYVVLSPEHPLIENLKSPFGHAISNLKNVEDYIEASKSKTGIERTDTNKTGVKLVGVKAINPINNEEISIWISDYVLMDYGTGACMAVPAHDQRDFEFAKKFDLPIKEVIQNANIKSQNNTSQLEIDKAFTDYGILINSNDFNGLTSEEAKKRITEKLKEMGAGDFTIRYRLRDWLISRQRYWGAPIPIIYCEKCGTVPVAEKDLPVMLPEDVEFKPTGVSPLKQSKEFLNTICPQCGGKATRETDTMDTFVDSSWYYVAYALNQKEGNIFYNNRKTIKYWLPVDFYIGGVEHAILHLLYARFISKVLHKLNIVNYSPNGEPFRKLFNIGMIYLHGAKMSKSKGNIISPDDLIKKYGTDALRGCELFIGPAAEDNEWQIQGISGIFRFLKKIWNVYHTNISNKNSKDIYIERTIKIVTQEIRALKTNTALSHLMELFNYLKARGRMTNDYADKINVLFSPFFPHLAEEIWSKKHTGSIFTASWPKYNDALTVSIKVTIAIQINGKTRDLLRTEKDLPQEKIETLAKKSEKVKPYLKDKIIKKVVYISGKVLNFVVG